MKPLIMAGIGAVGAVGKMIARRKANKQMDELLAKDPQYAENPEVAKKMALANTLLNARMPGAASAERNIMSNQANTTANVIRNSTDASQALAVAAGVGGQTNEAFENLQDRELQDYQRRYGNLTNAQDDLVNEQDKVYQDKLRRYGNEVQVRGAQSQNRMDNWQDVSNMGFSLADFSMKGGLDGLFKSGNNASGGLKPLTHDGTYGSNIPMTGGLQNRRTPNFR